MEEIIEELRKDHRLPKADEIACKDTFEKENAEDKPVKMNTEEKNVGEESFVRAYRRIN